VNANDDPRNCPACPTGYLELNASADACACPDCGASYAIEVEGELVGEDMRYSWTPVVPVADLPAALGATYGYTPEVKR
jgi:hypothetical protein